MIQERLDEFDVLLNLRQNLLGPLALSVKGLLPPLVTNQKSPLAWYTQESALPHQRVVVTES